MQTENSLLTYLALSMVVVFRVLSFVVTKIALQGFSLFCLIFYRLFIAAIFFIILLWRTGFPSLSRKTFKTFVLLALMQPGLYFLFETLGLQYTPATKTSQIIATIPIVVLMLSALFLKERLHPINMLGIVCSLAGVAMLIFGDRVQTALHGMILGDMLIFGAVLTTSIYMNMTRKLGESLSSLHITSMQIFFGALLFFPLSLWDLPEFNWQATSRESLIAVIVLTIFATMGAFFRYNYALTRIPAARAAACIHRIPLVTSCAAWILLGKTRSFLQLMGGALVLTAVFLANHTLKSIPFRKWLI